MSATRLLILGCLRWMQPAHGYSIRRELESWRAEEWANIAYGSIYFALNKMADEGLIAAGEADREGKRPARTAYTVTEAGEEEFQRLLREYWWGYKPLIDPFVVAVSFMDQLPPDEVVAALQHQIGRAQLALQSYSFITNAPAAKDYKPRHVAEILRLMSVRIEAEVRWAEEVIVKIGRGELP